MNDQAIDNAASAPTATASANDADTRITIRKPSASIDLATLLGLFFAIGVIAAAILSSQSNANFLNLPSFLIVIMGTVFVTCISYSVDELLKAKDILGRSLFRRVYDPKRMAVQLMDIAALARKKGLLALSSLESELKKDPKLAEAVQIVTDGYNGDDIERVLSQDLDATMENYRKTSGMARRASETAPAMGLIGTLVGLVQMLADLQNPDSIGPAMAVALLTTFYGAILGSVVLAPLAAKLDRNANDEALIRSLIMTAMSSIARQENPRRLEMLINSELPAEHRIVYFK